MVRMKNVSRSERPVSPSSSDEEYSSDHSHSPRPTASPSSLGVFSANSPSQPSPSSHHPHSSNPSPSVPVDPEYAALAAKTDTQAILKEKPFPLTPATNPFVRQLFQLQLMHLAQPRTAGNLTFVRQFYTHARHTNSFGINFRGVTIYCPFTSVAIREHFHLPPTPRCHFSELLPQYPWDDVLRTLCPEGAAWSQPRGAQRYLRRSDLLPEARPWLHFICNNILPTLHLAMVPKEQALYIYLLMVGRPVNLAQAIVSTLRQSILSTNVKHSLLFPHLITDIFWAYRVPEHPSDLTFEPAPAFVYVRIGRPRRLPSPPSPPSPPFAASPSEAPPREATPPPPPTLHQQVALLDTRLQRMEDQMAADRQFYHSILTQMAAHIQLLIPPPAQDSPADPRASAAAPPDPPADDPPA